LTGYGVLRLKAVFKADTTIEIDASKSKGLIPTISIAAILTFANPHVYLDTMILIGSISQQFFGYYRIAFALGACLSSFVFFFSLSYGAKLLEPIMKCPSSWRILDGLIALIMFAIAFKLASAGNWI
jgi:L-lysine exporter family protein LysE/ArgO